MFKPKTSSLRQFSSYTRIPLLHSQKFPLIPKFLHHILFLFHRDPDDPRCAAETNEPKPSSSEPFRASSPGRAINRACAPGVNLRAEVKDAGITPLTEAGGASVTESRKSQMPRARESDGVGRARDRFRAGVRSSCARRTLAAERCGTAGLLQRLLALLRGRTVCLKKRFRVPATRWSDRMEVLTVYWATARSEGVWREWSIRCNWTAYTGKAVVVKITNNSL